MRMKTAAILLAAGLSVGTWSACDSDASGASLSRTIDASLRVSVMVITDHGHGSGVTVNRQSPNGDRITFVWTAAHVVESIRVESGFPSVEIALPMRAPNGGIVALSRWTADVIFFDSYADVALLRVRLPNQTFGETKFYVGEPPRIGVSVVHVGSWRGAPGINSVSVGIVAQHGRVIDGEWFDQVTMTSFPGSSGGGVFLLDGGECIGLLLRGMGETAGLLTTSRRLMTVAERGGVGWAVDRGRHVPSKAFTGDFLR